MFGTQGKVVEEKEFISAYLEPGIHEAKIAKVEYTESSQKGTPGIKLTFEGAPNGEGFNHPEGPEYKGSTANTTWYLSEKAAPYTVDRIALMADKMNIRSEVDGATGTTAQEYVNALAGVLTGKVARWKFIGRESNKNAGKFYAELAGYGFVEDLNVPADQSKLKFNPDSPKDMVPAEQPEMDTTPVPGDGDW